MTTLHRAFPVDRLMLRDDGRTVEGMIVPFNVPAQVVEPNPTTGELERYVEAFASGSCTRMEQAAQRRGNAAFIRLTLDHDAGFDSRVGHGVSIEQRDDGAYASFRLYRGPQLEKVQSMIEESHDGMSVEFSDVVAPVDRDGVRWRRQVAIPAVTLTPSPTYEGARVLAMRDTDELTTPALDEVRAWLESQRVLTGAESSGDSGTQRHE